MIHKLSAMGAIVPQIRPTLKFSKDLKIKILREPKEELDFFDDWFVDVIRIDRKKVAFAMHSKTLFSLLIPYTHVGGTKGIPFGIRDSLIKFVVKNVFSQYQQTISSLFDEERVFCKTKERSVLGHMRDFKNCIDAYTVGLSFSKIDWVEAMIYLNKVLAGDGKRNYNRPIDLMLKAL